MTNNIKVIKEEIDKERDKNEKNEVKKFKNLK